MKPSAKRAPAAEKLRILILEDSAADAALIEHELKKSGIIFVSQRVESKGEFLKALKVFKADLILADYKLPRFDALQALTLRNKTAPLTPFIIVTGSVSEEVAVACMKQGADDYLLKDRLARLGEAVSHALAARRLQAEKIAADEALHAAASQWRATFDAMNEAVCLLDGKGVVLRCNRAMNRLLGLTYEKVIGKDCLGLICGKKKRSSCSFQLMMRSRQRMEEETHWHDRRYRVTVDPIIGPDGKVAGAVHVMSDVTDALEAAEKLSASEKQFRDLYENATIGLYRTTPDGRIVMVNRALVRMLGCGSFAELAARNLELAGFEPEYPRRDFRERIERDSQVIGFESAWKRHDGTTIFVRESAMPIRAEDGSIRFYDGTVEDLSERKRAENALREMSEIFRLFLAHSPIYVFIKDEDIRPVYLSKNYEKMLGRPLNEILGRTMDELFPSELSRAMIEDDKRILREGKPCEFIEEMDGRIYSTLKFPIFIDGQAKYLAGYTTDISERRRAEEMLRLATKRLELALDSAKAGTWDWDVKTGQIEWSPQMFELFGLDPRTSSASFETWQGVLHSEDMELAGGRIDHALKQRGKLDSDYRVVLPDGRVRWINALGEGVYDEAGAAVQMIGICQDISDRKRTEEQIRASLQEKEVLLKEIHHRVKNNLQIISGLLALQGAQIDDERFQRMIRESQSRIWTMALIHQTLYQTGNLAAIDMADYIRTLAGNLLSSHAQVAMPPAVLFDLLPVQLAIDKAIPLALVVNELVTNSLKHAFPAGRSGEIRITLRENTAAPGAPQVTTYELIVADDGAGLPSGFDPAKQKSLGLQLVTMLVKQLDGSMAISAGGGTTVRITFSPDEKGKRQS